MDDDEVVIYVTLRALLSLGYRATAYQHVTEALAAFRASPAAFDLVVTDLSMPAMSGFEFVEEVRRIRPEIPVLLTSGCVRPEDAAAAGRLGRTGIIVKPSTLEEMGSALNRLLTAPDLGVP